MKKHFVLIGLIFNSIIWGQNILGIDVSHYQGTINWELVYNDGKVFAFCKATEGRTYQDPNFNTYMQNGKNAGLLMGAYHFARPDNNEAIYEADNFVAQAKAYIGPGFLPPVLDLEDPPNGLHLDELYTADQLSSWVKTWLDRVQAQTGVQPIIYTNAYYTSFLDSSLNIYGLWIANPGTDPVEPPVNIGNWQNWLFKQYSWYGNVNGIDGNVDLNVFNGTSTDLNNLIYTSNIEDLDNLIVCYPNPVHDKLYLKNDSSSEFKSIEIWDIQGRFIHTFSPTQTSFDVYYLQPAIYVLKIELPQGQYFNKYFIKD